MKSALSDALGNTNNAPGEPFGRLYSTWSRGGYGLMITGNVMIDRTQPGEPVNIVI